jgi:hypothetical protein
MEQNSNYNEREPPVGDSVLRHPWMDHEIQEAIRQEEERLREARQVEEERLAQARRIEEERLRRARVAEVARQDREARALAREIELIREEDEEHEAEEARRILLEQQQHRGRTNFITYWTARHFGDHAVYPSSEDSLGDFIEQ